MSSFFSQVKTVSLVVLVLSIGCAAWFFTPLSSWFRPHTAPTTKPIPTTTSTLYEEQTQTALNAFPAKLQGLEKNWRIHLKTAIAKGLFGETVSFKISDLAHKQWQMETHQAIYFEDNSGGAWLKAVKGTLLNPQGQVVGQFKAPYGTYNAKTQVIHLQGGIQFQGLASR